LTSLNLFVVSSVGTNIRFALLCFALLCNEVDVIAELPGEPETQKGQEAVTLPAF
jgi:hypothetical protein